MTDYSKNILRKAMCHVSDARSNMNNFNFKEAYESIINAYGELQRLATVEKMNEIE